VINSIQILLAAAPGSQHKTPIEIVSPSILPILSLHYWHKILLLCSILSLRMLEGKSRERKGVMNRRFFLFFNSNARLCSHSTHINNANIVTINDFSLFEN
jgi:hypothetical protein